MDPIDEHLDDLTSSASNEFLDVDLEIPLILFIIADFNDFFDSGLASNDLEEVDFSMFKLCISISERRNKPVHFPSPSICFGRFLYLSSITFRFEY